MFFDMRCCRWGTGMIIYWFGFTEDVIHPTEKRFIVVDDFPKSNQITHLKYSSKSSSGIEGIVSDSDKLKINETNQSTSAVK